MSVGPHGYGLACISFPGGLVSMKEAKQIYNKAKLETRKVVAKFHMEDESGCKPLSSTS